MNIKGILIHSEMLDAFKKLKNFKSILAGMIVGTYKDVPVIQVDEIEPNEVYAIYQNKQERSSEPICIPYLWNLDKNRWESIQWL